MRTLFLSLLIGALAWPGVSGAAVTNRVKLAVAVPVAKVVRPSAEAPRAVPAAVLLAPDRPVDLAAVIDAFVAAVPAASEAELVAAFTAAAQRLSSAELVTLVAGVSSRISPGQRMTLLVAAMQAIAAARRIASPAWYDLRLYDGGTALWAIAEKAKWHAARGDAAKVQELYAYFIQVMAAVETPAPAHAKE